jgi:mRNA interferase RelE/StbE
MHTPKSTAYKIHLLPPALAALDRLAPDVRQRLLGPIRALAEDPRPIAAVKLTPEEGYRLAFGDFRILYRVDVKNRIIYLYKV